MNKISFFYKFFIINSSRGKYNWRVFLPFCGVIIGITTVALTFSIMEGMEYIIFNKLKNITFPAKIILLAFSPVETSFFLPTIGQAVND